jgi:hypothetical protein
MKHYLFYWKPDTVDDVPDGTPLLYGASEQFDRIVPGDVVWVVTSPARDALILVGRLNVVRVTSSLSEAQAWVGRQDLWTANWYALADKGQARPKQDIDISKSAAELRFRSEFERLRAGNWGQQLQSMRRLTDRSAAMLQHVWDSVGQTRVGLPLTLHGRYGRRDVYALFGIQFSQRNRTLIQGLTPRLSDGGYCIFITIDKSGLDDAYDYEDQLYADSFEWVTRRGVGEDHEDYVQLRAASTRVSLFVRNNAGDEFVYLGELRYRNHVEFRSERDGRKQQKYLFALTQAVPTPLLEELTAGTDSQNVDARGRVRPGPEGYRTPTRRPATLSAARRALSYVLGDLNRILVPAHHNYQVRLKEFLSSRGLQAEWERDFVDVRFSVNGRTFIGEVKVTTYLSLDEAFRIALGQLLFYRHIRFEEIPDMVMLLDCVPDQRRVQLASRLGVSVVVERAEGQFVLLNPEVAPALTQMFIAGAAAIG